MPSFGCTHLQINQVGFKGEIVAFAIGSIAANNTFTATTGTVTISVSAGSVLVLLIGTTALQSATFRTVSSVISTHLTYNKLCTRQHHDTNIGAGTLFQNYETWWAFSAGALTSEVITVTVSGASDTGTINAVECQGVNNPSAPWSTNVSLPATADGDNTSPTVSGISTTTATAVGCFFGCNDNGGNIIPSSPGTWIQAQVVIDAGGSSNNGTTFYYQVFASQQTSATWLESTTVRNWVVMADAFDTGAAPGLGGGSFMSISRVRDGGFQW